MARVAAFASTRLGERTQIGPPVWPSERCRRGGAYDATGQARLASKCVRCAVGHESESSRCPVPMYSTFLSRPSTSVLSINIPCPVLPAFHIPELARFTAASSIYTRPVLPDGTHTPASHQLKQQPCPATSSPFLSSSSTLSRPRPARATRPPSSLFPRTTRARLMPSSCRPSPRTST